MNFLLRLLFPSAAQTISLFHAQQSDLHSCREQIASLQSRLEVLTEQLTSAQQTAIEAQRKQVEQLERVLDSESVNHGRYPAFGHQTLPEVEVPSIDPVRRLSAIRKQRAREFNEKYKLESDPGPWAERMGVKLDAEQMEEVLRSSPTVYADHAMRSDAEQSE